MLPESRMYLWDVLQAANLIDEFLGDSNLAAYLDDTYLRSAVERQLQIVGEALAQLAGRDPETARTIPELPRAVAFRNILVHRYADVDHELVWGVLRKSLPALSDRVRLLLEGS